MKKLKIISKNAPNIVAPIIPGKPKTVPTEIDGDTKVKSVPIIHATLEPIFPTPLACIIVANPEANIVAPINAVVVFTSNPRALAITNGTTIIPPNAANIC